MFCESSALPSGSWHLETKSKEGRNDQKIRALKLSRMQWSIHQLAGLRVKKFKHVIGSEQFTFSAYPPIYLLSFQTGPTKERSLDPINVSAWNCVQGRDSNHCQHEFIKMLSLKANEQWTSESFTKNLKLLDAMSQCPRFPTSWQASIQALKQRRKSLFLEAMPRINVYDMRSIKGARESISKHSKENGQKHAR